MLYRVKFKIVGGTSEQHFSAQSEHDAIAQCTAQHGKKEDFAIISVEKI